MTDSPKINNKLLVEWRACSEGLDKFNELMPDGEYLEKAMKVLIDHDHDDYAYWLFSKCRELDLYKSIIVLGYLNSGNLNSGDRNSGDRNSGDRNSGNLNSGDRNSGDRNSGDRNSGDRNSGNLNSGDLNSGDLNSGNLNSGDRNSGNLNSGDRNSGNLNSGDRNSGNLNSGYRNSGYRNSGDLNSGNRNSGFFNAKTPTTINVFDKLCDIDLWNSAYKPNFIYFSLIKWVPESEMTGEEKINNPKFYTAEGYLKTTNYKEAFIASWDKADPSDRIRIKELPNFNADTFYEISGIKVDED